MESVLLRSEGNTEIDLEAGQKQLHDDAPADSHLFIFTQVVECANTCISLGHSTRADWLYVVHFQRYFVLLKLIPAKHAECRIT